MKFTNSSTQNSGLFSGCCRDNGTPFKNGIITICLHKEIVHSSLNYSCWLPFLLVAIRFEYDMELNSKHTMCWKEFNSSGPEKCNKCSHTLK